MNFLFVISIGFCLIAIKDCWDTSSEYGKRDITTIAKSGFDIPAPVNKLGRAPDSMPKASYMDEFK